MLNLSRQLRRRRLAEQAPALAGHVVAHVDRFLDVAAGLGAAPCPSRGPSARRARPCARRGAAPKRKRISPRFGRRARAASPRTPPSPPATARSTSVGAGARERADQSRRSRGSSSRRSRREAASTHSPPMKFLKVFVAAIATAASLAQASASGRRSPGTCPGSRGAAAVADRSRFPPYVACRSRRSGPSRRSMITVTFGLSS